jgi:hypothetical protein
MHIIPKLIPKKMIEIVYIQDDCKSKCCIYENIFSPGIRSYLWGRFSQSLNSK